MRPQLECIQCSVRQALEAAEIAGADLDLKREIALETLKLLMEYDSYGSPAELTGAVHRVVGKLTGELDAYRKLKEETIRIARGVYPVAARGIEEQDDRLLYALKVSAVGNVIDAGVYGDLREVDLEAVLEEELTKEFAFCHIEPLREDLVGASSIVVVGDNAGETVFDRLLISEIKRVVGNGVQVFYGVRSGPIINDATIEDAVASGLDQVANVISTGCDEPGLVLDKAHPNFIRVFKEADVVISKGQGNYEALSNARDRAVYFLLKAKCEPVARDLGVKVGEYVFLRK
ncbi:MAG TPA: DUF89 family protein [Firmicutes bacterium]|nr:DUF89 family protein [Bacillota bacterium]